MKPDQYYPDGYRGGGELPDDQWIDRIVWPEDPPPAFITLLSPGDGPSISDEERERANLEQDVAFVITEDNLTGRKTGPPRTS
jgi:hypothetical protein